MRSCCPWRSAVLTSGVIVAHFDQIYGAGISKDTISRITDKIIEEMNTWFNKVIRSF